MEQEIKMKKTMAIAVLLLTAVMMQAQSFKTVDDVCVNAGMKITNLNKADAQEMIAAAAVIEHFSLDQVLLTKLSRDETALQSALNDTLRATCNAKNIASALKIYSVGTSTPLIAIFQEDVQRIRAAAYRKGVK
jgi:uncharacterized small protein (DUF1192 family)